MTKTAAEAMRPFDATCSAFCAHSIDACAAVQGTPLRRGLGPLAVDVYGSGSPSELAAAMELFRAGETNEAARSAARPADLSLYLSIGAGGPLGRPPAAWPFEIDGRDSFHRVHWSPKFGTALTSDEQCGVWNLMDQAGARGLLWLNDVEQLPSWEFATPLRHHVHWQALRLQSVLVHSAAIDGEGGCFLLTGPGGSGKSTTSAAAIAAGRGVLAEDLCWLDLAEEGVVARRLYGTLKITEEAEARFPFLGDFIARRSHVRYDKTLVYLGSEDRLRETAPVRALFCLSGRFAATTRIEPCSRLQAFTLLAPSTLFLLRTSANETASRIRQVIERLPVFHVTLGADPVEAIKVLDDAVGRLP